MQLPTWRLFCGRIWPWFGRGQICHDMTDKGDASWSALIGGSVGRLERKLINEGAKNLLTFTYLFDLSHPPPRPEQTYFISLAAYATSALFSHACISTRRRERTKNKNVSKCVKDRKSMRENLQG